jgi:hypothetical protein
MSAPTAFANVHSRRAPMCSDCKPAFKDFCIVHCRFCNTVPRTCTKKEHRVATPVAAPACLDCKPASKDFCPAHCKFCNTVPRTCTKKEHRVATPIAALAVGPPVAAPVATSAPAAGTLLSSSAPSFVPKPLLSSTVLPTGDACGDDSGCEDDADDDGFTAAEWEELEDAAAVMSLKNKGIEVSPRHCHEDDSDDEDASDDE